MDSHRPRNLPPVATAGLGVEYYRARARPRAGAQELAKGELKRLLSILNLRPGDSLLDLGSGLGHIAWLCCREGVQVLGIDSSEYAIQRAKETYRDTRLKFEVQDLRVAGLAKDYDRILAYHVLEHLETEDGLQVLRKCHEWLREDGFLVIGVPIGETRRCRSLVRQAFSRERDPTHARDLTLESILSELDTCGWAPDFIYTRFYTTPFENLHKVPVVGRFMVTTAIVRARSVVTGASV